MVVQEEPACDLQIARQCLRQAASHLRYTVETSSRYFPNINVSEVVTESLKIAYERNTSAAIRELRRKLASDN
ncbi:hypothetical protein [Nostoc sp. 'Lobaria pulmonaria (5183) cyanobiont']|uniref:hypothetical protein n=1 Tax=Nostoc sp. 'Lobaria pulmonaria (5183) cyanobiont' TaxID=1618022 RepID=UPI000CF34E3C|nr:hypothetical protein [Nostoc sp. 'Lobaria pulmonaria (5183) cyanobiont']